VVEASMGIVL
jgi:hypothetical protein